MEHPLINVIRSWLACGVMLLGLFVAAIHMDMGLVLLATGFGWWKGCACCATCTYYSDGFSTDRTGTDYTIVSGTPTVSGGVLTTTSASFVMVADTTGSTNKGHASVTANVDTNGGSAQLYGAYTDGNSHIYCDLIINGASSTFKLWQVSAGSPSQLGSTYTFAGSTAITYTLVVCWTGSIATGTIISSGSALATISAACTQADNQVAIGAAANGGTVTFDDLLYSKHYSDDSTCTACETVACSMCDSGTLPPAMSLTFTGFTNGVCSSCSAYNATYVVPYQISGGSACQFYDNLASDPCTVTTCGVTLNWGSLRIQAGCGNAGNAFGLFENVGSTFNCTTFSNFTINDGTSGVPGARACDPTSASCAMTSIP